KIFYNAMEIIEKKTGKKGIDVFRKAIENVSPVMEVKSRRIGGATYQVPVEVPEKRRFFLASKWIIMFAKARKGKPMAEKLAEELIAASKGEGASIKKRDDTHRMAEANKAFAHFR
ncbi:MAG: 30S ribosomal protein S7, partial [Candidatus Marinimicrobia bacterium]|nr:30S ribosomal protein S7 [Candidatus Neomarinimicrobiota bacterium]